ncbi:MAG: N-acetylmuramic acid 6-phosphate etherase [Ignavibacteria bacterium]|nr:N-acetylmuramic acid 6-phosphate etherase [Ignavibacteria bacterium]
MFQQLSTLHTEKRNFRSMKIDSASVAEILHIINEEDKLVPFAVEKDFSSIAKAVNIIVHALKTNGRLLYVGAGTSGRLGILDATECPPTFGTKKEMVQGIIAGGKKAMVQSIEGAEDIEEQAGKDLRAKNVSARDVVCGIAASIRTPYVVSAMQYATSVGAKTIFLTTNPRSVYSQRQFSALHRCVDIAICIDVGAEIITGSTRMKSGTAQKMVLNMLTTASFIRLGKVYENMMIDLQLKSNKLSERAKNILMTILNITYGEAEKILGETNGNVKVAIVMHKKSVSRKKAIELLKNSDGFVRKAIG